MTKNENGVKEENQGEKEAATTQSNKRLRAGVCGENKREANILPESW